MNKEIRHVGLGLCDVLAIIFIVLKLVGVINWSWLWVLSPIWLPLILIILVIFIVCLFM